MNIDAINEAAQKYSEREAANESHIEFLKQDFLDIVKSDAAKQYWKEYWYEKFKLEYERLNATQFKAEQKQLSNEDGE